MQQKMKVSSSLIPKIENQYGDPTVNYTFYKKFTSLYNLFYVFLYKLLLIYLGRAT